MRFGIAGVSGRMGRLVARAAAQAGVMVSGGTARSGATSDTGVHIFATAFELVRHCDVLIDFSHAANVVDHASAVCEGNAAWVLGTTGLSPADAEAVRQAADRVPVVQAANFSPVINLMLGLAEQMARSLPAFEYDAEIIEMHHRQKQDAPSGTALALGVAVASGRGCSLQDSAQFARQGQTGPRPSGSIGFASLRGGQVVGEHTLLFAGDGEHIALSHRALDRAVFARGAVQAALWAGRSRAPGLYSMTDVLNVTGGLG